MVSTLKSLLRPIYGPILNSMTASRRLRDGRAAIQSQYHKMRQSNQPIKIIIGASETRYTGWIPTDIPQLNVLEPDDWAKLFEPVSLDRMLAEHVFQLKSQLQQFDVSYVDPPSSCLSSRFKMKVLEKPTAGRATPLGAPRYTSPRETGQA